jgi:hypothetical protein
MAGAGWRSFTAGAVLTAAQVQTYLQDQAVQVYATTAARSSALGTSVSAGMVSFVTGTESLDLYTHGAWTGLNYSTITNSTATSYTLASTDGNTTINFTNASAQTVTVPDILDIGERVDIIRDGAGTVIIAAGTGVTTWAGAGTAGTANTYKVNTQYGGATIMKVAANSYRVIGSIIP